MESQPQRVRTIVIGDDAGNVYEVPWEIIARYQVSGAQIRELQDLLEADTTGLMAGGAPPASSPYSQASVGMRKAGGDPHASGQPFLKFTFTTVFIKGTGWSAADD